MSELSANANLIQIPQQEFNRLLHTALKDPAVQDLFETLFGTGRFTKSRIIQAIRAEEIVIKPPIWPSNDLENCDRISAGSIDVGIKSELRIPLSEEEKIRMLISKGVRVHENSRIALTLNEGFNYLNSTKAAIIKPDHLYILRPGEAVIAISNLEFFLYKNVCAEIHERSKFARAFVILQLTPIIEPNVRNGGQVLEIRNVSSLCVALVPGARICKMIFSKAAAGCTMEEAKYDGFFVTQCLISEEEPIEQVGHAPDFIETVEEPILLLNEEFFQGLEENWPVGEIAGNRCLRNILKVFSSLEMQEFVLLLTDPSFLNALKSLQRC